MSGIASTDEFVTAGRPLPRIASVDILERSKVRVVWRDGGSVIVNLAPVLKSHRHFIPLRDDSDLFRTLRPAEDGTAIEWDGGIELSAEWIERLPPAGMENAEFRQLMERLGLSLEGMAEQLEISRRQVASYRAGLPIPAHVALAVRHLAEIRNR